MKAIKKRETRKKIPSRSRILAGFIYCKKHGSLLSTQRKLDDGEGKYRTCRIDGRSYSAHRLIWMVETGTQPPEIVHHIDLDGRNNRWSNLFGCRTIEHMSIHSVLRRDGFMEAAEKLYLERISNGEAHSRECSVGFIACRLALKDIWGGPYTTEATTKELLYFGKRVPIKKQPYSRSVDDCRSTRDDK